VARDERDVLLARAVTGPAPPVHGRMTAAVAEPRDVAWADSPRPTRLLDARDVGLMLALMALALGLRLAYFSGFGLGDDVIYRHFINNILVNHYVLPDNTAYRVAWWLPTAFACRILGLSEAGMIAPVTIVATLGIGLLYAFGKALWGRPGGLIAALLLLVHPLDFAWSTMLASDIFASFFSALTILCLLRALGHDDVDGPSGRQHGAHPPHARPAVLRDVPRDGPSRPRRRATRRRWFASRRAARGASSWPSSMCRSPSHASTSTSCCCSEATLASPGSPPWTCPTPPACSTTSGWAS